MSNKLKALNELRSDLVSYVRWNLPYWKSRLTGKPQRIGIWMEHDHDRRVSIMCTKWTDGRIEKNEGPYVSFLSPMPDLTGTGPKGVTIPGPLGPDR